MGKPMYTLYGLYLPLSKRSDRIWPAIAGGFPDTPVRMSLEELWQLFPIFLTEHQVDWEEWYLEEESLLKKSLPCIERISHIGSTANSRYLGKTHY